MSASYPHYFLFDLDGTLALSEHIKLEATQEICKEANIRPMTKKEYDLWAGAPIHTIFQEFLDKRGVTYTPELIHDLVTKRREAYDRRIHMVERHDPIVSLLQAITPHYKTALVTTTIRALGLKVVKSLGIEDLFDVMVFGDDVKHNKPDPEPYEHAAQLLGAKPEECLVFEDSESGITAATAFGAQVVKVTI
jgi:HAD superfamily hydrolase (TIGR01509 family)